MLTSTSSGASGAPAGPSPIATSSVAITSATSPSGLVLVIVATYADDAANGAVGRHTTITRSPSASSVSIAPSTGAPSSVTSTVSNASASSRSPKTSAPNAITPSVGTPSNAP